MIIRFGYDVVGTIDVEMEVDDEEVEGMTENEIIDYVMANIECDAEAQARRDCDWSIGDLEYISIDDGVEHWMKD